MSSAFLDTNILVYAFTEDPRAVAAEALLASGCDISVQVLNEFVAVARRKLGMSWAEIGDAVAAVRALCGKIHPLDVETHLDAVALAERHGFAIYDALIVASALRAGSAVLHSEDMQDGMMIAGRLQISNPFRVG